LTLFAELCARVPDPAKRAELLGVSADLQAAWECGAALPLAAESLGSLRLI
jgi:hypothetical protein